MNSSELLGNDSSTNETPNLTANNMVLILLYTLIFFLSTTGNILVIWTIAWNKRLRTITNVFLLNLAISDLLLSVFCIPFTLVGMLLREFVFGPVICSLIPFFQAISVSVSVWTLVAISLERYYAICQPLQSRLWQTMNHAYRVIALVWFTSILIMMPIAILSKLIPMKDSGKVKCREVWPNDLSERTFSVILDILLLVIPLGVLLSAYSQIVSTLQEGLKIEVPERQHLKSSGIELKENGYKFHTRRNLHPYKCHQQTTTTTTTTTSPALKKSNFSRHSARRLKTDLARHNMRVNFKSKKKVIRMLFFVVVEFFICWTPLYTVNTVASFDPPAVYGSLGSMGISLIQLLAFVSSCCNPITYCFMYKKFRQGLLNACGCSRFSRWRERYTRDVSTVINGSSYGSRRHTVKSEITIDRSIEMYL